MEKLREGWRYECVHAYQASRWDMELVLLFSFILVLVFYLPGIPERSFVWG